MTQTKVEAPFIENNNYFKNLIINGDMQIWQRSTSAVTTTGDYVTVDRWKIAEDSDGSISSEQSALSVADQATTGCENALLIKCTGTDGTIGAGQSVQLLHSIEAQTLPANLGYGTSSAQDLTLSFWVKTTTKTGTFCVAFHKDDEAGDLTGYFIPIEYTVSSAGTWEYKTIVLSPTAGSTSLITSAPGAITRDNGLGLRVDFTLAMGSNYTGTNNTWASTVELATSNQVNFMDSTDNEFYLTGVQLELGSAATALEKVPHDVQLRRCQRYYQQIPHTASGSWQAYPMWGVNANVMSTRIQLPVTMRSNPTGAFVGTRNTDFKAYYNGGYQTLTGESATDTTDDSFRIDFSSSGAFAANESGGAYIVTTSGRITLSAEL